MVQRWEGRIFKVLFLKKEKKSAVEVEYGSVLPAAVTGRRTGI